MMVTQVMAGANTPYRDQVVIDKGSRDGVYDGQPVISDKGVVGQVIAVSQLTSRVLLICDTTHALPIQVLRNDIRVIASGTGCTDDLQLEPLPNNIDIRVGMCWSPPASAAVSRRLPGRDCLFGKVDNQRAYTIISAKPTADLQRLRYLLLLWGGDSNPREPSGPSEVYRAANERIMQVMPQVIPSVQTPETDPAAAAPEAPAAPAPSAGKTPPKPAGPKPAQPKPADTPATAAPAAQDPAADSAPARPLRMRPQQ